MVKEIVEGNLSGYYLTTGRTIAMYNNSAQTSQTPSLMDKYGEDLLLANENDAVDFTSDRVILRSRYGESAPLKVKFTDKVEPKTLFTTFHHARSKVNALFGDERDELILTPAFKSVKVEVINL
jgi:formate dehydrogenase major subunit